MICAVLAVTLLAGCNINDRRLFDGVPFAPKVRKVDRALDEITISVKGASRSIEGAQQAAVFGAVDYCVNLYGSSDIEWQIGPDTPVDQLNLQNDTLVFRGRCPDGR
ncbi:hypothetical protein K3756_06935 [Sulfitobacter sp. S190]|nr:hypothetical protein K3756_06935 [Sulfitobacter sp. S190]